MRLTTLVPIVALAFGAFNGPSNAGASSQPDAQERMAALKKSLGENQARLREYEWIETTRVLVKGEEKSRKQLRCYYGADGTLQKLPVASEPQAASSGRGRRGGGPLMKAVVEHKKEEMQDYMERAADLVHMYVPPDAARMKANKDAGKTVLRPLEQGRVRIELAGYLKPGDLLSMDVVTATSQIGALTVASYLTEPQDAVNLAVQFALLMDGTSYPAQSTLDAPAKNVRIVVSNSGYRLR
jgi:hypothetical protein